MSRRLDAFRRSESGGTTVLFAASLFVLLGFGALAIDVGGLFYEKQRQQTANDLAAIAAAADPLRARAAAEASVAANGFAAATVQGVQPGIYKPDPTLPAAQRFTPGPANSANAVKIDMQSVTPMFFGRVLAGSSALAQAAGQPANGQTGGMSIASSAIAVQDAQTAFAIGSRLAKLDGGVLSGLLGSLFGSPLSLSVMDYEALLTARIDLFDFAKALAIRAHLSAATYDDVLRANVGLGDVFAAAQQAARDNPASNAAATGALGRLAASVAPSQPVDLASLVSFGSHGQRALSEPRPLAASLTAFDFVSTLAQIADGDRQIDLSLSLNISGIAAASLKLGIGKRPAGTSLVSVGRLGTNVSTAQTRLLLTIDLVGTGQAALVRLPLYLELAAATARLSAIQCNPGDVTSSRVTLGVTPALVDAWIGQVSASDFANFRSVPNPPAAVLLNLAGLARVTGRAHATMTNLSETPVNFTYRDILRGDKRATSTQNFTATLLARLVSDLDVRVEVVGLGLGIPGLGNTVSGVIAGAATPLDQLLSVVLGTLGLGLGQADTWVSGVRCGGAVLVR